MDESQENLQNQTPSFIMDSIYLALEFLSSYGWFLLAGLGIAYYLKNKFEPRIQNIKQSIKKPVTYDPETIQRRQDAMERARKQMQDKHDELAEDYAVKQKERDEKKRAEKVEDWNRHLEGKGYRSRNKEISEESNASSSGDKIKEQRAKSTLRSTEFSPLMGGGANTSFRPSRRGGGGGG